MLFHACKEGGDDLLLTAIARLSPKSTSKWALKSQLYLPNQKSLLLQSPAIYLLSSDSQVFVMNSTPEKVLNFDDMVVADIAFIEIMAKLRNIWTLRQTISIDGTCEDSIKVARITINGALMGLSVCMDSDSALIEILMETCLMQVYSCPKNENSDDAFLICSLVFATF